MTEVPGFVIRSSPPRTKKTSNRVVNIGPMCRTCGKRGGFPKVLPSEAYVAWEAAALVECMTIKAKLRAAGVELPILGAVSIEALIYRETNVGDACGYYQAIGDMLQAAGILQDDRQIEDFDGSRRLKDAADPRIQIYITVLSEAPVQESLL